MRYGTLKLWAAILIAICFVNCEAQTKSPKKAKVDKISTTNKPKTKMEENTTKPVLNAKFDLQGNVLQVEYKVKNSTTKPIYLFVVLGKPDAPNVYAGLRTDGTLHLAKMILPLPKFKNVEVRRIPFAKKVEAGEEFAERIEIAVPIAEYNPYFPKKKDSPEELKTSASVLFSLQFIREIDGLEIKPAPVEGAFNVRHRDLFGNVETLTAESKSLAVQVLKRTDEFEAF
jgi:hypothetical protein